MACKKYMKLYSLLQVLTHFFGDMNRTPEHNIELCMCTFEGGCLDFGDDGLTNIKSTAL